MVIDSTVPVECIEASAVWAWDYNCSLPVTELCLQNMGTVPATSLSINTWLISKDSILLP